MTRPGATRSAAVIGVVLAIVIVGATLPSPPDYLIAQVPLFDNVDRLERLMDIEVDGRGGFASTATVASVDLLTGEGDGVRTILHYRDTHHELPEGFSTFLDVEEECVRIRVASTVSPAADEERIDDHAEWLRQHVRTFLDGAPRDPCLGRALRP